MNFLEIGHFYTDEFASNSSLNHLYYYNFSNIVDAIFALFIDDYNQKSNNLDVTLLKNNAETILNRTVDVFYESDMVKFYDKVLSYFNTDDLVINKYNRGKTKKLDIVVDGEFITLAELSPVFKPSCVMLSLAWTLYRSGIFKCNTPVNNVHTLLHLQYEPIEYKVQKLVKYICDHKCITHPELNYWIYK